jgi:hypothetical protein
MPPPRGQPLYSKRACAVTAFFVTPLGAAVLLAINAQRTGRSVWGVVGQAVAVAGVVVAAGMIPVRIPAVVFTVAQVLAVRAIHEQWFTEDVAAREAQGLGPAPWWHAAAISVVGLIVQLLVLTAFIWAFGFRELARL